MYRYAGILGPLIFFITTFVVSALQPDYHTQSQMISELGATGVAYAQAFNYLGFLPNGILITVSGAYLFGLLSNSQINPLPAILIIIHGLGMVLATWLSCDVSCTPAEPTWQQLGHNIIGSIKFPALHLAILILAIQLFKHNISKAMAYGSLAAFVISTVFMILFVLSVPSRELTGIYQRLFIGSIYLWLAAVSFSMEKALSASHTIRQHV